MVKRYKKLLLIILSIIASKAMGFSSSSYLVTNSAINKLDFEIAYSHYLLTDNQVDILDEFSLHNKLLTYVNLNLIEESKRVSEEILKLNKFNQEAWIVKLMHAKLEKNNKAFKEYKKINFQNKMELINFIFF